MALGRASQAFSEQGLLGDSGVRYRQQIAEISRGSRVLPYWIAHPPFAVSFPSLATDRRPHTVNFEAECPLLAASCMLTQVRSTRGDRSNLSID